MKILDNIRDVFKSLKHKKPQIFFCPRCAHPKLQLYSVLALWLTPQQYVCTKCGYVGPVYMELEKAN
ncbi:MAG: hypothetical protein N3D85_02410 [Candidatus Bathyarchaeota archaeon]|nr:hypothetical protein [Candidatus Bathyarchaeota archaeon]